MRVETVHGRFLLCGGLIPSKSVKPGQIWAAADGSNWVVVVKKTDQEWVTYSWNEGGEIKSHEKTNSAFQARYCLVLDDSTIPPEFL